MVVVKHGKLPAPGKQFKVYLNVDKMKQKWYLRVTHTYPHHNQHFRAGTYKSKEQAMDALKLLDPMNPKKGRQRKGTVDEYNGQWRVRAKHRGEHMHVGYFKDRTKAEQRLKEVIADHDFLEKRYNSLIAKRKRKRDSMNRKSASLAMLRAKLTRPNSYRSHISSRSEEVKQQATSFTDKKTSGTFSRAGFTYPLVDPIGEDATAEAVSQRCNQAVGHDRRISSWRPCQQMRHESQQVQEYDGYHGSKKMAILERKSFVRKRCLSCGKTQIVGRCIGGEQRLFNVFCESCINISDDSDDDDVGWCSPAILQEYTLGKKQQRNDPNATFSSFYCDPRNFFLLAPISYSDGYA